MDNILEIAILEMGRQRGEEAFNCLEVIQWIYPQDWEHFTEEINESALVLKKKDKIIISENGDIRLKS